MSTATSTPRIAIVGGGPGSLTLLLTLHKRGVPATLYEREASFSTHRHLGGTLDLGHESGQRALRENGLQAEWEAHSRPEGDSGRLYDSQKLLATKEGSPHPDRDPRDLRPEIDRSTLRKIMLDRGAHELTFANGHTAVTDLVVGADGAHSRVRPLLSLAQPIYHGVTGAEIELAETVANIGSGSMWAGDAQGFLGAQVNGDGRIRTYAWFRAGEDWKLPEDPDTGRAALLERFEGWAPWMRRIIEHCDPNAMYQRALYYLPTDHSWAHVDGVMILGDAAHLMSPFAGAGANLAMLDALELGILLKDSISAGQIAEEREAGIKAWEEARMSEGRRVGAIAARNIEVSFSAKGPLAMIDEMKDMSPALRRKA